MPSECVWLAEWEAFQMGIVFGCAGILFGVVTLIVWRKMEHKAPIQLSDKTVLMVIIGVGGALALGVGMCFSMVWGKMILGIVIGLIGIVVLLCLIPLRNELRYAVCLFIFMLGITRTRKGIKRKGV